MVSDSLAPIIVEALLLLRAMLVGIGYRFIVSFIPYTTRYKGVCALLKLRFDGSRRIMKLF